MKIKNGLNSFIIKISAFIVTVIKMFKETIYIKMSDIVDVVSCCLKKIKTKNTGKNKDNPINYLSKDCGYGN